MKEPLLRPASIKDLDGILELFKAAIEGLTKNDYSREQRDVWMKSAEDLARWKDKIESYEFMVAEDGQAIVGMASRKSTYIDVLYTHPKYVRSGLATRLIHHLEQNAIRESLDHLETDGSLTARPFFEKMGFRYMHTNDIVKEGIVLTNFRLRKNLR